MINLVNIIIEPGKTFQHIKEKDDWWIPFIFIAAVGIIFAYISGPAITRLTEQIMTETGMQQELPGWTPILRYIGAVISPLLIFCVISFIIWMLANSLGADWDYIKTLDLFVYSAFVIVIKQMLNIVVLLIKGTENIVNFRQLEVSTGLDLIFSPENPKLYTLLSGIDIFEIWIYTLVAFGVSEITGLSKRKSAVVSISTFILGLVVKVLLARKGAF